MDNIVDYFSNKYGNSAGRLLDAVLIFCVGWYLAKFLLYLVIKMLEKRDIDGIIISFVRSILDVVAKVIVIISTLITLGVPSASIITILATAGAALVLGMQNSLSGIVSGFAILLAKPFAEGDTIEVDDYVGKIHEIQLLYTVLMTFDNKMVTIPNNKLASSIFVNYSHEDVRRVDMNIGISYDNDIEHVKKVIRPILEKHPLTLKNPEPYVRVGDYMDSSIDIVMRVWTKTENYYDVKVDVLEQIKKEFDKEGIVIPYPQMDVHLPPQ